jgi:putative glycosyltransferase
MDLSIVTTLFKSAPYVNEFYSRISVAAEKITGNYEIIFVNDGSPDNSLDIVLDLYHKNKNIKIIDLSRNFGHHKAMMTGLEYAEGDLVFLIDCDLEEEPELLKDFFEKLKSSDADVVYGKQIRRKGGFFEKISGFLYYKIFNFFSGYPIPENLITVRLMRKKYVKNLILHKDKTLFMAGLWAITGFKQIHLDVNKHSKGTSSYTLLKKIAIAINSITSFSAKPLIIIFYLGLFLTLISFCTAIYFFLKKIIFASILSGWTSLIVSLWFLGGIIVCSLGIIGIYLSKIFEETKDRPYTVIRDIYK